MKQVESSLYTHKRLHLLFALSFVGIFLNVFCLHAQNITTVTGKVTDLLTNEPISFAIISFKKSGIGTTADIDGKFKLQTNTPGDSLFASFVGYKKVGMPVKKGKIQEINFSLSVNRFDLSEVVIKAGENPAHILLRKIIDFKPKNNRDNLDAFQYEIYNKLEFDISNITEDFKNKKVLKPISFIFKNIDSSSTNKKPFLPIFVSESISDYYYRSSPSDKKEIIKATKISGIENGAINQFLGDMYQNVNIYNNFVTIFKKGFISPISDYGLAYYKYSLVDSMFIGNKWCYKLTFKPRRKQELTFTGHLWISDSTFAVRKANLRISPDANINFVEDLAIIQEYDFVNAEVWMKTKDVFIVDFLAKEDGMGFIGRKSASYKDFVIHKPQKDDFYHGIDAVEIASDATEKSADFWLKARHDSLSKNEKLVYHMVDTVKSLPVYRTALDIVTLIVTGYKPLGKIELGPYMKVFSFNPVEGSRFRLGIRTSNAFSNNLILESYLAYGTRDKKFKYGGSAEYIFSKTLRQSMGYSHRNDVEELGQSQNPFAGYAILGRGSDNALQGDNLLTSLLRRVMTNKYNRVIEHKFFYEKEWQRGFSNKISFVHRDFNPLGFLNYSYFTDDAHLNLRNELITSEISLHTRFAYKEKFINGRRKRMSLGSEWPVLHINYTLGLKGVLKSDFTYHKWSIKVDDRVEMKPIGFSLYVLEAGKTWGTLPYPLLEVHRGNETYSYNASGFNMMNFYEFVSDQYLSLALSHHFEGLFFDKLPLFRKLKWREVANARMVVGSMNAANRNFTANNSSFNVFSVPKTNNGYCLKPYAEAGVAVENIFKFIRIDFIWRLTYLKPNMNNFAVMGSLQIMF